MRHVLPSLAIAAALAASTLGATAAQAAPPNSIPVSYLAVGDSYPAGWGVTGAQSYPSLLDTVGYANIALDNNARAGADTYELVYGDTGGPSQLSAGNSVVTITVGANDIDWVNVISGDPTAIIKLPARLGALAGPLGTDVTAPDGVPVLPIAYVLKQVAAVNPNATILVTGYPHLFGNLAPTDPCDVGGRVVSGVQTAQANTLTDQLNAIIEGSVAAVSAGPVPVKYVDVVPTFAGHGICDTQTAWLYDLDDISTVPTPYGAFHPNARGQKAYAQAVQKDGFRSAALRIAQAK